MLFSQLYFLDMYACSSGCAGLIPVKPPTKESGEKGSEGGWKLIAFDEWPTRASDIDIYR